jgi:hypothetical protein
MINLGKNLFGFRSEYLKRSEDEVRRNQFFTYNILSFMFWVLVLLTFVSAFCYGLVIFESWWLALLTGLIFGGIFFLLMLLVMFLNMTTQYKDLYEKVTNMDPVFNEFRKKDLRMFTDDQIKKEVDEFSAALRSANTLPDARAAHLSSFITSAIKLVMILIISFIVANGMEILIFRQKIDESMAIIRESKVLKNQVNTDDTKTNDLSISNSDDYSSYAEWMLNMVDDKKGDFILVDCHSLLLIFKVMNDALGVWKMVIDILFSILFLIPFILVRRSGYIAGGDFLKEATIIDISTTLMFFLLCERKRMEVKFTIESEYDYNQIIKE